MTYYTHLKKWLFKTSNIQSFCLKIEQNIILTAFKYRKCMPIRLYI